MHKKDTSLGSIVFSKDFVTYRIGKVMADILIPHEDWSQHHVHNTQHYREQIKDITPGPRECITLYDVTALFTSAQVATDVKVVENK